MISCNSENQPKHGNRDVLPVHKINAKAIVSIEDVISNALAQLQAPSTTVSAGFKISSVSVQTPAPGGQSSRVNFSNDAYTYEVDHLFGTGTHLFWKGRYSEALGVFQRAIQFHAEDARYWYFKGFCEIALGDKESAEDSLAKAIVLHENGCPNSQKVSDALSRVQGKFRVELERARLLVKAGSFRSAASRASPSTPPRLALSHSSLISAE